jgi:putative FmdB family regulatory protein
MLQYVAYYGLRKITTVPIHEYKCKTCGARTEALQKLRDKPLQKCQKCGGPLVKLISSPAIQFKGSGFYITDYAHKNTPTKEEKARDQAPADKPADKPAEKAPEKTGSKSEAKAETAKKDSPAASAD